MRRQCRPAQPRFCARYSMALTIPDWLANSGPVMWLLLALSLIACTIIIAKLIQFALLRPLSAAAADAVLATLRQDGREGALQLAGAGRNPLQRTLAAALAAESEWQDE